MVNVAIVGVGYWGPNLVRNFSEAKGAGLLWACDLNKERLNFIKMKYPLVKTTHDYQKILKDKR